MKNFVESSELVTVAAPTGGTVAGRGELLGTLLFGVATTTTAETLDCAFCVDGVVELAKTSALEINIGDKLWWDANNKVVYKTAAASVNVGVAVSYAANPSDTVKVLLRPIPAVGA